MCGQIADTPMVSGNRYPPPATPRIAGAVGGSPLRPTRGFGFLALAFTSAGTLAAFTALFLPAAESASFGSIIENTLVQRGEGQLVLVLVVFAFLALCTAFSARARTFTGLAFLLAAGALAVSIVIATDKNEFKLYPLDQQGNVITSGGGEAAKRGTGIYLAVIGAGLQVIGTAVAIGESALAAREARRGRVLPSPFSS